MSSSKISEYVGRGNFKTVTISFNESGIFNSEEIIIIFFGCVFKVLLKFFNFRIIEKSLKKLS